MRLREVADVNPPVPAFGGGDVGEVSFLSLDRIWADDRFDPSQTIVFAGIKSYNPVAEGDILVPKVTPTFSHGRVAIARGLVNGLALATSEVFVVRPRNPADAAFLRYRLLARDFRTQGEANQFGVAGLRRIPAAFVKDVRIDAAVWARRQEIVRALDAELNRMRDLTRAQERLVAGLRTAWAARLAEIAERCSDTAVPLAAAVQVDRPIMYGIVLPGEPVPDGVLLVKGGNVERGALRTQDLVRVRPDVEARYARARLAAGDLLITIRGSYGAVAEVPAEIAGANITQDAARIAPRAGVSGRWLQHMLRSPWCQQQLAGVAMGAGVKGINIRDLKRIRVPLPPLLEQQALAAEFDAEADRLTRLRATAERLAAGLVEYRDALITEAVTGVAPRSPGAAPIVAAAAAA